MHFGHGFKKTQLEENDYKLTPEVKRKLKEKQKMEEDLYNNFLEKRNKKDTSVNTLDMVKCTERDYINNHNTTEFEVDKSQQNGDPEKDSQQNPDKTINKNMVMELDSDGEIC